jgi:hypothetical protein
MTHCLASLNQTCQDFRVQSNRMQPSTKVLSWRSLYYLSNIGGAKVYYIDLAGDEAYRLFGGIFAATNPHSLNLTD